ncbi:MAG: RNA polymerase sigma factor [Gemmataceae bacterium]
MGNGQGNAGPIARWLESLRGYFRARPARPARRARVFLERLEDRCVTAALAESAWEAWPVEWVDTSPAVVDADPEAETVWSSEPEGDPSSGLVTMPDFGGLDAPPLWPSEPEGGPPLEDRPAGYTDEQMQADEPAAGPGKTASLKATTSTPPVVTPSLAPRRDAFGAGGLPEIPAGPFRLVRSPAADGPLEVRYTLTAFNGAAAVGRDRAVTLAAGAGHADVPNDAPGGHEIVTLTVQTGDYHIARPSVSLFVAGDPRACSDLALVGAYRRGQSPEAFAALVERNRPAVLRVCHRVLGNWHDAEDVSQYVFLALGTRAMRLQTTLAGWLRTVAHNASIALLRARNRRTRHERATARPLAAPEDASAELREELDAALQRLAAPLRDAVRLRYLEGWSQIEAAQRLGCPRGTLSQRAAAGVRGLRGVFGAEET